MYYSILWPMQGMCLSKLIMHSVLEILQNTFGIHLLDYQITQKGLILFLICIYILVLKEMKEYIVRNLYSQLLQPFTIKLYFIKWICEKYDEDIPLYLGGCVLGDITGCVKVCSHIVSFRCSCNEMWT